MNSQLVKVSALWSTLLGEPIDMSGYPSDSPWISFQGMLKLMEHYQLVIPENMTLVAYAWIDAKGMPIINWQAMPAADSSMLELKSKHGYLMGEISYRSNTPMIARIASHALFDYVRKTYAQTQTRMTRKKAKAWATGKTHWFEMVYRHNFYWKHGYKYGTQLTETAD